MASTEFCGRPCGCLHTCTDGHDTVAGRSGPAVAGMGRRKLQIAARTMVRLKPDTTEVEVLVVEVCVMRLTYSLGNVRRIEAVSHFPQQIICRKRFRDPCALERDLAPPSEAGIRI